MLLNKLKKIMKLWHWRFSKEEHIESELDPTPQILDEHYENFDQTPDEIVQTEMMIREDKKHELRKLLFNQGLRHESYYL
jgi:hypothetical protein